MVINDFHRSKGTLIISEIVPIYKLNYVFYVTFKT